MTTLTRLKSELRGVMNGEPGRNLEGEFLGADPTKVRNALPRSTEDKTTENNTLEDGRDANPTNANGHGFEYYPKKEPKKVAKPFEGTLDF